jgi:two-component system alkaline phosphatase synthesis response regulator PhoP/two-component system response regulator ResD
MPEAEQSPLILVADDDAHIVRLVELYLEKAGYRVAAAVDGDETLRKVRELRPDLLVLDVMMPGPDGLEITRGLRRSSDLPIIMLTARSSDVDRIAGLQFGADDYVTKPFNPVELVARVQSVLRRARTGAGDGGPPRIRLQAGSLVMDLDQRTAGLAGRPLHLRPKEFDLLSTFARFPGFALDRERLLDLVWGSAYYGDQRTVDVHVAWLREKLAGSDLKIEKVWGVGYKLVEIGAP